MEKNNLTKKKILQDHKRKGKTFVPPFRHMLGPLHEISWVKTILPELLWIALIQNHCGNIEGVEIITELNRVTREFCPSEELQFFATISSFEKVKSQARESIQSSLEKTGELSRIREALVPLLIFYPDCPLRFLGSIKLNFNGEAKQCLEGCQGPG